jgi:hypothetical protein
MNAAELATLNMKTCARCHCVFPIEDFYIKQGRRDSYCRQCRRLVNLPQDEDLGRVTYHHRDSLAIPTATRRCRCCGKTMANFAALWPSDISDVCVFCAQDVAR